MVPPIRYNLFKDVDNVAVNECQLVIGNLSSPPLGIDIGEKDASDFGVYLITSGASEHSVDCSVL